MASASSVSVADRYRQMSDDDLVTLARSGEAAFEPAAWQALRTELDDRQLAVAESVEEGPETTPARRFSGLLAFVRIFSYVSLALGAIMLMVQMTRPGFFTLLSAVMLGLFVYGMVLFERKDPATPRLFRSYHTIWLVIAGFALVSSAGTPGTAIVTALKALAWLTYWTTSQRVREVFRAPV
jgi:hypothetical protein